MKHVPLIVTTMSQRHWILPFSLGATTAIALTWTYGRLVRKNDGSSNSHTAGSVTTSKKQTSGSSGAAAKNVSQSTPRKEPLNKAELASTPRTSNTQPRDQTQNNGEELMDSMELDHRLLRKAEAVIQWRTTRLVLVVERCTNDHNYSAILRTAEALGIQYVYMIDPPEVIDDPEMALQEKKLHQQKRRQLNLSTPEEIEARRQHHLFARKATEWLTVKDFSSSEECVEELRAQGYQFWVTDLSQHAECLTMESPKVPEKVALVMGTEAVGCSQYMLDQADKRVYLPLRGFADSLNLSVATALIIHQLFVMDPTLVGGISEETKLELRQAWFGKLCKQRLLTPSQRKTRTKLQNLIKKCHAIQERAKDQGRKLQPSEQQKLEEWPVYQKQLDDLEAMLDPAKVQAAVQEWVDNPPAPLTDVRRADEHRVCYVGKNTKTQHKDHWKDMAATSNAASLHMSSAASFREKVKASES